MYSYTLYSVALEFSKVLGKDVFTLEEGRPKIYNRQAEGRGHLHDREVVPEKSYWMHNGKLLLLLCCILGV